MHDAFAPTDGQDQAGIAILALLVVGGAALWLTRARPPVTAAPARLVDRASGRRLSYNAVQLLAASPLNPSTTSALSGPVGLGTVPVRSAALRVGGDGVLDFGGSPAAANYLLGRTGNLESPLLEDPRQWGALPYRAGAAIPRGGVLDLSGNPTSQVDARAEPASIG